MRNSRSRLAPCERAAEIQAARRSGQALELKDEAFLLEHLRACSRCRLDASLSDLMTFGSAADSPALPLDDLTRRRWIDDLVREARDASGRQEGDAGEGVGLHGAGPLRAGDAEGRRRRGARGAWWAGGAVAAALVVGVAWLLGARLWPARAPEGDRRASVAPASRFLLASGRVLVDGAPTRAGAPLGERSMVQVEAGQAVLALPAGAKVWLKPGTQLQVDRLASRDVALFLRRGEILASVTPSKRPRLFRVKTSQGWVVVHGTVFAVQASATSVLVHVLRGEVQVSGRGGATQPVRAGKVVRVHGRQVVVAALGHGMEQRHEAALRLLSVLGKQDAARLAVRSIPSGALVLVDDTPIGHTPLVADVRPGDRVLTVLSPGRAPIREQVALGPATHVSRTYELARTLVRATSLGAPHSVVEVSPSADGGSMELAPAVLHASPRPAVRSSAKDLRALLARARAARERRDWADAASAYGELIARHSKTPQAWTARVALGLLLLRHLGRPAAGLRRLNEYLRTHPRGGLAPEAAFGRAQALRRLGRTRLEREALESFLRSYPTAVQASLARARLRALSRQGAATLTHPGRGQ